MNKMKRFLGFCYKQVEASEKLMLAHPELTYL